MKSVKKETVDVPQETRKTAKPPKAASLGVLALCLGVMGFVVKKGMDLDRQEAEAKAKAIKEQTPEENKPVE